MSLNESSPTFSDDECLRTAIFPEVQPLVHGVLHEPEHRQLHQEDGPTACDRDGTVCPHLHEDGPADDDGDNGDGNHGYENGYGFAYVDPWAVHPWHEVILHWSLDGTPCVSACRGRIYKLPSMT